MPAPRSAALLREIAEIALRRAKVHGISVDAALKAWQFRAKVGLSTIQRAAAMAIDVEVNRAIGDD